MTLGTHVAGGLAFSGLFASLIFGINVMSNSIYLFLIGFASVLPDVDHPKSLVGRIFKPLSKWINRHYGHRTITHSIFFIIPLTLIVSVLNFLISGSFEAAIVFSLAYLSHPFFDTWTKMGVSFFYPFSEKKCKFFESSDYLIRTGDMRAELALILIFIGSSVWMQSFWENGFWTTYNTALASPSHLFDEYKRSDDLIRIEFTEKNGTETVRGEGFLIEANETEFIAYCNGWFGKHGSKVLEVIPEHTGKKLWFEDVRMRNVSIDSLNRFADREMIKEAVIWSDSKFKFQELDAPKETKKVKLKYPNDLRFLEGDSLNLNLSIIKISTI